MKFLERGTYGNGLTYFTLYNINEGGKWVTLYAAKHDGLWLIRHWFFGLGFCLTIGKRA
jgi:hypothetical protein